MQKNFELSFSRDEMGMLRSATGGATFSSTKYRDIPVLTDWTKQEALLLEQRVRDIFDSFEKEKVVTIVLSNRELLYLIRIHQDNMTELDPIEYPTIAGYDWEEAEHLLEKLTMLS